MKLTIYETVTLTILNSLNSGVVPWRKPWHSDATLPTSLATGKPYRGINSFLLGITPYSDHRWLTFKQVQERGGQVKKGAKSTMVVFWKHWQPPSESDESKKQIPVLRYFHVFNVEQCDGLDIPELYRPKPLNEPQRIEMAELLVQSMPNPPSIAEGGTSAWYRPSDDHVQMPPLSTFENSDSYYATLMHELGHSTGHESRLNRKEVTGNIHFGSGDYSKEELVAELTSAFCCATVGLDNSLLDNAASYINGWLKVLKGDPKAMVIAAAQAQKAADYIQGVTYS
jgi:antirestriction protein ArdC